MIWLKLLRIAVAILVSMFLAYVTELLIRQYSTTFTPGMFIAQNIVPIPPKPNELSTLGTKILLAFVLDSLCYLILISSLFVITRKLWNGPGNRSQSAK
jgi:hypothetical protein